VGFGPQTVGLRPAFASVWVRPKRPLVTGFFADRLWAAVRQGPLVCGSPSMAYKADVSRSAHKVEDDLAKRERDA
jgi:hypothetical protein